MKRIVLYALCLAFAAHVILFAKPKAKEGAVEKNPVTEANYYGLKFRLLGPALTSGRIGDIAVSPICKSTWYIVVASGGVWKTTNAGVSFRPIFDSQGSYSIGCITIDPNNPNTIWVGSGENNSQRSVGWGDGVYRSDDGGKTWNNMGLKTSEHIGKIVIDPRNSNVVYVAAQGPLWGPGGERGLYKTTDGGKSWIKSLEISENTGVSDIVMDPRNPDVIYASSYQRRRHVWTLIDGGPEAAIYKSSDAGATWNKLQVGLPAGEIGRIGLAISPINPDILYALIEGDDASGGFYRSNDRGASWEKRSGIATVSAQYYQELFCDPKQLDKVYMMDTYLKYTEDGGKTFKTMSNRHRHVDDHAFWQDPSNTLHLLIGGDGGLYESFDGGETYRFFENLPVTQFYRISTDNSVPFYYVYGGTQDNATWGVPSRTVSSAGITNEDWFQVVGGDGYEPQIDPVDPNIVYGQWQYGNVVRFDRKSGEYFYIQPQPEAGEELRWNWDTPLLISPHSHTRLYIAANKLFRSDDRGDTWKAISGDLTRQIDRNNLEIMGKVWEPDAIAKNASTSLYGNIISLSESPVKENLIYIGTDDGLIQVTENAGSSWTKIDKFPGVPEMTYVSDVYASNLDANVVYAAFNNHKRADFKPYLLKSVDKGKTWTSISGNLPENGPIWSVIEDHVNPNLLFVGTEFGAFFTVDGGQNWVRFKSGVPTIAVRDLEIQKRENDLLLGTFGRGIYILDDYSPLRYVNKELFDKESYIFPVKDALIYNMDDSRQKDEKGEQFYRAENPPFGATFTYYLKEDIKTKKDLRKEAEGKRDESYKYPPMSELIAEDLEQEPYLIFSITDESGNQVRNLTATAKSGIARITWDLRYPDSGPVSENTNPNNNSGLGVMPGKYFVTLFKNVDGATTKLFGPVEFTVKLLNNTTLPAKDFAALVAFRKKIARLEQAVFASSQVLSETDKKLKLINKSLLSSFSADFKLLEKVRSAQAELESLSTILSGNKTIQRRNENQPPSVNDRLSYILWGIWSTSSAPSDTQIKNYNIIAEEFQPFLNRLTKLVDADIKQIENELDKLKAPWTPSRIPEWKPE